MNVYEYIVYFLLFLSPCLIQRYVRKLNVLLFVYCISVDDATQQMHNIINLNMLQLCTYICATTVD